MKVLVIGAGWFGCSIADVLESMQVDFDIVDKNNSFFSGSSSKNQNRLHFGGFHYSRSHSTRLECRNGYDKFVAKHPGLSEEVKSYYIVASKSVLDAQTYMAIFKHEKAPFRLASLLEMSEDGIDINSSFVDGESALVVSERWIDFDKSREHFTGRFSDKLLHYDASQLSISRDRQQVSYGHKKYDMVFDATYGKLIRPANSEYEVCVTLLYRKLGTEGRVSPVALTVVDGQFYSLYAYKPRENLYTLTHVKHTPVFSSTCIRNVEQFISDITISDVNAIKDRIEGDVCGSFTTFLRAYEYHSYLVSTKTKYVDTGSADRSNRVDRNGIIVSVIGGKITGALDIEPVVRESIANAREKMIG